MVEQELRVFQYDPLYVQSGQKRNFSLGISPGFTRGSERSWRVWFEL